MDLFEIVRFDSINYQIPMKSPELTMEIEIIGVKVDQSYQWSFRPKSAWVSIEMTTIGEMHPTLPF